MRCLLTIVAFLLHCALTHADERTFRFPEHKCAITLPKSSEWQVLPRKLVNDPEVILLAIASDGKVSASLSVVELALDNKKEAEEVIKFQVAGMKAAGLEVTSIQKKDFVRVPGWWITSKGPVNGNDTVQTTWTIFANDRVYMLTGSMMGKDLSEPVAKRAAAVLTGITIDTKSPENKIEPPAAAKPVPPVAELRR